MRGLVKVLAGVFIVVTSFIATTYFLRQFSEQSKSQNAAAPITSAAQEAPPPIAQQIRGINLVDRAADLTGAEWQAVNLTIIPTVSGNATTFKLVETTASGVHRIETHAHRLIPGDIHTLSVFVKPGDRANIQFEMRDDQKGKYGIAIFDLSHQKVIDKRGDVANAGIQAMPYGWFRCWAVMPYATDSAVFNFALLDNSEAASYQGDGRSGLLIWGPFLYRG
jgi:hypothetical protein